MRRDHAGLLAIEVLAVEWVRAYAVRSSSGSTWRATRLANQHGTKPIGTTSRSKRSADGGA